jgi:hypothetical protein
MDIGDLCVVCFLLNSFWHLHLFARGLSEHEEKERAVDVGTPRGSRPVTSPSTHLRPLNSSPPFNGTRRGKCSKICLGWLCSAAAEGRGLANLGTKKDSPKYFSYTSPATASRESDIPYASYFAPSGRRRDVLEYWARAQTT